MLDQSVQSILAKPGNQWTAEEKQIIANMVKNGMRAELKTARSAVYSK